MFSPECGDGVPNVSLRACKWVYVAMERAGTWVGGGISNIGGSIGGTAGVLAADAQPEMVEALFRLMTEWINELPVPSIQWVLLLASLMAGCLCACNGHVLYRSILLVPPTKARRQMQCRNRGRHMARFPLVCRQHLILLFSWFTTYSLSFCFSGFCPRFFISLYMITRTEFCNRVWGAWASSGVVEARSVNNVNRHTHRCAYFTRGVELYLTFRNIRLGGGGGKRIGRGKTCFFRVLYGIYNIKFKPSRGSKYLYQKICFPNLYRF